MCEKKASGLERRHSLQNINLRNHFSPCVKLPALDQRLCWSSLSMKEWLSQQGFVCKRNLAWELSLPGPSNPYCLWEEKWALKWRGFIVCSRGVSYLFSGIYFLLSEEYYVYLGKLNYVRELRSSGGHRTLWIIKNQLVPSYCKNQRAHFFCVQYVILTYILKTWIVQMLVTK